ncbi:vacuolar protein sorting-associated protein 16 [Nadsonia fulvescens var. elongata DSM 6958]|uniref:Probable vacuolar protein sorting-associated protein 16 homolog n=1 Tax=Nadsonia fulvescens var. elongata DSM 6958 TaxID=857566 RepID=A0A1E3PI11_9ASCO|nr:vacuolar protein sorting-associated protein 16 [Nadsonia fulvescens var. elongata DSM 6958]
MPPNPILSWERLEDNFYRSLDTYTMIWEGINLDDYDVACSPFGGAIAMTRNELKLREYKGGESRQTGISIFSGVGKLMKRLPWDSGRIKGLGWTNQEHIIAVSEEGITRHYYDFQGNFKQFSLGKEAEEHNVVECKFWENGFVALLSNKRFIIVSNYQRPNPRFLAKMEDVDEDITSWAIRPPTSIYNQSAGVLVGLATKVFILDTATCQQVNFDKTINLMMVSPNGQLVVCQCSDGSLDIVTTDFQNTISTYNDAERTGLPSSISWCGNDAIGLVWEDELTLVGFNSETLTMYYDSSVILFPELDGLRIFSSERHEFFAKVPSVVVDIFKIGSTTPGAILLDCVDHLERRSPKADENLQIIGPHLIDAVDNCIQAAKYEFDQYWQKRLLKAASLGKSSLDLYNSDEFVTACDNIRVLNAVRQFDVGMMISYDQFLQLTPERLVERLLLRQMHFLSLKLCMYLHVPSDKIYIDWACSKIKLSNEDDDTLCEIIVGKLAKKQGVSYVDIAKTAYDEGRAKLATILTSYEPRAGRQVPLLISMGEDGIALTKAVESGDTDLIIYVFHHLRRKLSLAQFFRLLSDKPMANRVFEAIIRSENIQLLKDFYYQDDKRVPSANLLFIEAYHEPEMDTKFEQLEQARKIFQDIKDYSFEAKMVEESTKLLHVQQLLESDYEESSFVGLSLTGTIFELLKMSQNVRALKLKNDFKVPDKRFWWSKVKALVSRRDWSELMEFAKTKRSPIGYEPFYQTCLQAGSKSAAANYVSMCTNLDYTERVKMYIEVNEPKLAAEEAFKFKDITLLKSLVASASAGLASEIERYLKILKR